MTSLARGLLALLILAFLAAAAWSVVLAVLQIGDPAPDLPTGLHLLRALALASGAAGCAVAWVILDLQEDVAAIRTVIEDEHRHSTARREAEARDRR